MAQSVMAWLGRQQPPLYRLLVRAASRSYSGGASVWSFGDNSSGAVGLPTPLMDAYEPTRVPYLPARIASVAAGHYHSLAVTADGEVWAWGRNNEGQLGRGTSAPRDTWFKPERVLGLDHVTVRAASASGVVSAAIADDGSLWVWGTSNRGQLGLGQGITQAIKPSKVEALEGHHIVKVSFGWGHAMAQTRDGKLFGWGYCEGGRLGKIGWALDTIAPPKYDGLTEKSTSILEVAEKLVIDKIEREKNMPIIWRPSILEEVSCIGVSDVACGLDHSLLLCCNGKLLSCGDNTYGQLGRNTRDFEMAPVSMDIHPLSLAAGLGHSLVLYQIPSQGDAAGETKVLSWGWNRSYQLGRDGRGDIPGMVKGLEGERPISVSAGRVHSITLTSKGEVWAWGSGNNGRLGLGSSLGESEPALVEVMDGLEILQAVAGFDHNLLLVAE